MDEATMDVDADADDQGLAWRVRGLVYAAFITRGAAPTVDEIAAASGLPRSAVLGAFRRLHDLHAVFLNEERNAIRMAHPFSGVVTPFRVVINGIASWANCAWDAFGIATARNADAVIDATYADTGEPARLTVTDGQPGGDPGLVHFLLPFRYWYDDLVFT